ncbi:hypothetical protein [Atopococcus tabaci]|uniref:hypothetical protein n=1 Tax=Atopococcus tabaci TaxID=269774 RepID=UPI000409CBD0|nr:hypothetical protein [Atopococcus tabaci]
MSGYDGPSIYHKELNKIDTSETKRPDTLSARIKHESTPSDILPTAEQPNPTNSLFKRPSTSEEAKPAGSSPTIDRTSSLPKKKEPIRSKRSSTPFQVGRVPSPYYGLHPRPEKKKKTVDYHALKKRLQKEDADCLLFEGFVKQPEQPKTDKKPKQDAEAVTANRNEVPLLPGPAAQKPLEKNKPGKKTHPPKKKSALSKTLSGIMQDEQQSITTKTNMMSSLFSTHYLQRADAVKGSDLS